MLCPRCHTIMRSVMSFSKEKNRQFKRCPKCHCETRPEKLRLNNFKGNEHSCSGTTSKNKINSSYTNKKFQNKPSKQ